MKTKIILTLFLLASVAYEASAFKIILSGGKKNKYNYVSLGDQHCYCKGAGDITCPISFDKPQAKGTNTWFPMNEIVAYVMKQIKTGSATGETFYGKELPVKWQSTGVDNVEIDIDTKETRGIDSFNEQK